MQTIAPSIPFPVFNPLYPQGTSGCHCREQELFLVGGNGVPGPLQGTGGWTVTGTVPPEGGWNFEERRYCNAVPPHPWPKATKYVIFLLTFILQESTSVHLRSTVSVRARL